MKKNKNLLLELTALDEAVRIIEAGKQEQDLTEADKQKLQDIHKRMEEIEDLLPQPTSGHWNHRVLAHPTEEDVYFSIHEVYYDETAKPNGATINAVGVGSESLAGIEWTLKQMLACLEKPVLWGDKRFPQPYEKPVS